MTKPKPKRARQLGVTDAEYERLLEAQGGHCALCSNTPKTRRLHVDHDHATGEVRGLLCYVCNRYLPASRDAEWHRRAARYLDAPRDRAVIEQWWRAADAWKRERDKILADLQLYTMRR